MKCKQRFILHTFVLINSNVLSWNTLPRSWNDWLLPSVHASSGSMFPDVTTHAICGLRNSENQWACGENTLLTAKHLANKQLALSPVFSSGSTDVEATAGFVFTKDDVFQPVAGSLYCLLKLVPPLLHNLSLYTMFQLLKTQLLLNHCGLSSQEFDRMFLASQ